MEHADETVRGDICKLFVALTIVKSKPETVDIAEYLKQIRSRILPKADSNNDCTKTPAEDTTHWKVEYEKSQEMVASLTEQVASLELENTELKAKSVGVHATPNAANSRKKRKLVDAAITPSTGGPAKQVPEPQVSIALQEQTQIQSVLDSLELEASETEVTTYLKHIYALQKNLAQTHPAPVEVGTNIIQLSQDVYRILDTATAQVRDAISSVAKARRARKFVTKELDSMQYGQQIIIAKMDLLSRTFFHIVQACCALNPDDNNMPSQSQALLCLPRLVLQFFHTIHQISVMGTEYRAKKGAARRAKSACKTKSNKSKLRDPVYKYKTLLCERMGQLVVFVFSCIYAQNPVIYSVLETALQILFDKVGGLLHKFMFDKAAEYEPGNVVEPPDELEALSTVWILERVLVLHRQFQQNHKKDSEHASKQVDGQAENFKNCPAAFFALEKLQNTLLKAVFKNDDISLADRLFGQPDMKVTSFPAAKQNEEETGPWYEGEIWRLLGWNIFASETAIRK